MLEVASQESVGRLSLYEMKHLRETLTGLRRDLAAAVAALDEL